MSDTLASLEIELTGKMDGLTASLNSVQNQLTKVSSSANEVGSEIHSSGERGAEGFILLEAAGEKLELRMAGLSEEAGLLGLALADLGGGYLVAGSALGLLAIGAEKAVDAFMDAQTASVRLSAVLASSGAASGQSAAGIEAYAQSVADSTTYTKEQIEDAASTLLQFQGITGDAFTRVLNIAENLSAATGRDLTSSLRAVAMAAQDPVNGLEQLRRAGAGLTDQQLQYIAAVAQSGGVQAAQNQLLDDLEAKTNGAADALGNTMAGSVDHLSTAFKNLAEQIGSILDFQGGLQTLANWLNQAASGVQVLKTAENLSSQGQGANINTGAVQSAVSHVPLFGPALSAITPFFTGAVNEASNVGAARSQVSAANSDASFNQYLNSMNLGVGDDGSATSTASSSSPVASDASSVGEKAVATLQQQITLQNESASARAGDLAVMKLQDAEAAKHQTASATEIAQVRSLATQLYNSTAARKEDTSEAKKAQDQSDALTKSLNEALVAANKQDADVGLTDIEKAASDANAEMQKRLAQYPLLHGALTQEQQDTAALIAQKEVQYAADKDLYTMYEATLTPLEQYQQTMTKIGELEPFAKTPDQIEAVQRAIDNANDSINEFKPLFDEVAQDVDGDFEKMFSGLMDGSVNSLKSFSNIFLGTFETLLAKMATLAILNPVIVPVIEGLGGALGISTTGINSVLSKLSPTATLLSGSSSSASSDPADTSSILGSGSSLSSALSIASLASKAQSLYSSLSSGSYLSSVLGSGVTSSIDNFGSTYLGTANADAVADGLDSGSTLSQGLGSGVADAGAGFAGNFLGNTLFSRTGSSATDADIGGTVGALAGSELGPIGSAVGSFLGNAIGGLFGAPVSDKAEATDLSFSTNDVIDTTGATSGSKYSAANRSISDGITAFAQQVNAMLTAATGSTVQNNLTVKAGSRDGNYFTIWGNSQTDFANTTQGLQELTNQLTDLYAATGKSSADVSNLKTAIGHIDFSNTTQALSDINFALNFDSLGKAATVVTTVDTEVANLNSTFATYQQTTERLGLSVSQLNTDQQEQMALLQSSYTQSTNANLLGGILPGYSDFEKQSESYSAAMKDAVTLGLSAQQISTITLENNIEVQELLQSNNAAYKESISDANTLVSTYGNLSDSWSTLIASLTTGSDSTLSSTAQLDALRQQVQTTGAAAETGDTTAQSSLLTLIPEFISASQSVNGYDAAYTSDQQLALSYAESAKSVSDQQLAVQQSILDAADDATSLLTTIAGTGTSGNANDKLVAAIKAGYTGLTNDQINAIFDSVGLTAAPGNGARTGALNQTANSGINTSLNDIFHALGVPGFATGGQIGGGGGKPGVDSIPLIAMPGEFIMRAKAVSALGAPSLNYMNATGRLPANDSGGDIASLRADVQQLTSVVYAGFSDNNGHLGAIRGATASSAATANRALNRAAS